MTTKKSTVNKGLAAVLGGSASQQGEVKHGKAMARAVAPKTAKGNTKPAPRKRNTGDSTKPQKATGKKKKPGEAPVGKTKVTYYIVDETVKGLKYLAVDLGRKGSDLVEEAVTDLVKKYARQK